MWISFHRFASKLTYCQPIDIMALRKLTQKKVFMATDLDYIKYVVEQIDLPDISFKKMFGDYMVIIKLFLFYLFATTVFLSRFWKKHPRFLVMIVNKNIHTTAQNCITCWILIIQILQGKRLLPYIIVEKTSQRNKTAMFLFARVFGLFYYYFVVFRKGVFYEKRRFIDIWHACPG